MSNVTYTERDGCMIFQPMSRAVDCPVEILVNLLSEDDIKEFRKFVISNTPQSFIEEYRVLWPSASIPQKLLLLAHGNPDNFTFYAHNSSIDPSYWTIEDNKHIMVAHSCYSAGILRNVFWKNKFNDWVASVDKVWFGDSPKELKVWKHFFSELCQNMHRFTSGKDILEYISSLYFTAMLDVYPESTLERYCLIANHNINIMTCKNC